MDVIDQAGLDATWRSLWYPGPGGPSEVGEVDRDSEPGTSLEPVMAEVPAVSTLGHAVARGRLRAALLGEEPEPVRVDRFELRRELGNGGMGTVWLAHDAQLDRPVALKFLRRAADGEDAEQRLFREAQALAKISHPNVVPVYDVGRHEGRVWVAMEYVPGRTLRAWAAQEEPTRRRLLGAWVAAGRGLAAVHAAGLVHRDVKPDNVMLGDDGRVRLVDFGLVRAESSPDAASRGSRTLDDGGRSSGSSASDASLTRSQQFVGTPAYAAPEQRRGGPVDRRVDQYAFCVSVWEALSGRRPRVEARSGASGATPEGGAAIPARVRRVLVRGLLAEPQDRFDSMEALLDALEPPRGRWAVAAALLAGGAGLSVGASLWGVEPPCTRADQELTSRWDDDLRAATQRAFAAASPAYGAAFAPRVIAEVDGHVEGWAAELRDTCEDTRVRQTHSERVLEQRMACIERNTALLRALFERFPRADAEFVERSMEVVAALPRPERCQDLDALGPEVPRDPAAVRAVRDGLARVEVERRAGHESEARAMAEQQLAAAEALDDPPVYSEALLMVARILQDSPRPSDHQRAMDLLWHALDLAQAHRHDEPWFEIWVELLDLDAARGRYESARLWARRAEVTLERGPASLSRSLDLAFRRGVLEARAGDLEASERWLREGLGQAEGQPGVELGQARLWEALGNTLRRTPRKEQAREAFAEAEERWTAALGPEHPYLARYAFNLGLLLVERGELPQARARLLHARARWEALYGARAPVVGRAELALANLEQAAGDLDGALRHALRGRDILVESDPRSAVATEALEVLALVQFRRGELRAAHDTWRDVLGRLQVDRAPDDLKVLWTRSNLAEALLGLGRHAEAHALLVEHLPLAEAKVERDPGLLMLVRLGLGRAELAAGRLDEALGHLQGAQVLIDEHGGSDLERADLFWALARVERGTGAPASSVRERAALASRLYREVGSEEQAEQVRRWAAQIPGARDSSDP